MGEFDLIARYFRRPVRRAVLGVGDDCALLQPRAGWQLAISSDMLVAGRHFFEDTDPARLGHKALAVNLSDLAACGAHPLAFTLALALPRADADWLAPFARGLLALADAQGCELVGGDTTQGPLNICITVFGEVPTRRDGGTRALLRSGARPGDDVYVSGSLGEARLGLEALRGNLALAADYRAHCVHRLEAPTPRVALGEALVGVASAAIDLSDGLLGDLGHILEASSVGATIDTGRSSGLLAGAAFDQAGTVISPQWVLTCTLSGGDDYELAFTAPASARDAVAAASRDANTSVTCIGRIDEQPGLRLVDARGNPVTHAAPSFDHFAGP